MAKILIVDDDPDIRIAISSILKSRSHEVIEARDGEEALSRLQEEKPDLMFLDLLMPKMDGFAVIRALQDDQNKTYPNMPIVIISSIREEASHRRYELEVGHKLNVKDYIEKPIEPFVLLEHVERLLFEGGSDAKTNQDPGH